MMCPLLAAITNKCDGFSTAVQVQTSATFGSNLGKDIIDFCLSTTLVTEDGIICLRVNGCLDSLKAGQVCFLFHELFFNSDCAK